MRYQSKHSITRVVRSMSVRARVFAAVVAAFLAGGVAITATAASASTGPSASLAAQVSSNTAAIASNKTAIAGNSTAIAALQGVAKQTSAALVTSPETVSTGGSFNTYATLIGTLQLKAAGTYLIVFNAKATPNTSTNGALVFPQFFVYNQAKNSSFTGDLFNVGAGALEPYGTNHDSYYSGSGVVTAPAGGETLYFYAFGYDSNTGGGAYALDMATASAVRLAG